ncbi:glutamate 5-kinase [Jeotgalibacillus proteolyticus]|uniref:Glutamate 5-kinase n=1 Tax=Jeotgalibacillus proteolyticus TaxID=2082395 RepID=A0A2S5GG44_9BACL|nr:glutamate 5-kinase [Jeotgalibacillus proteolyticus]PPA71885.1 glutamate 5-kinase [Jeotgalibacillus proteolyticus]
MTSDNQKRIVIKIGSSSLTSLSGDISRRKIQSLTDQVAELKDQGHEVVLVSSGAVAAGYRTLGFVNRPSSLPEKQAAAAVGQGRLIETYSELFSSHGYAASQILITRSDFSDETRYNNVRNTINVLLERGIVPIVNENDTVTTDRLRFGDNDTLSAKVAGLVASDQLIILSDIDGLYNADPRKDPSASLLKEVSEITPEIEDMAGEPGSSVGTGGMRSKIDAFKISMASGIPSFLGKAGVPQILVDAVNEEARGTYFDVKEPELNLDHYRQWIAFNSGPEGEILIQDDAKETIINEKGNLLPSQIYQINGYFKKGSVVRIMDLNNEKLGLGVVNYSSKDLEEFQMKQETNQEDAKAAMLNESFVCELEVAIPIGV